MARFILLLLIGFEALSHAQGMVEYSLGAGRAATMTAPGQGFGKGIAGVFDRLNQTLKPKKDVEIVTRTMPAATTSAGPQKPFDDPKTIPVGLSYEELLSRFGPPSMQIAGEAGRRSLTYITKDGQSQIELRDGKVASNTFAKTQAQQSAVVVLQ